MENPDTPASRPKPRILPKLLAACLSLVIALVFCEIMLRLIMPQNLSGMWRIVSPRGYLWNKAGGTAKHQFGDRTVHYRFNQNHMRGPEVDFHRPRILVLGDSWTFGWLLEEDNSLCHRLQSYCDRDLPAKNFQILNGAAGGWGTSDYVAFTEDMGETISPTAIVVFINSEDIDRSIKNGLFRLATSNSGGLERHDLSPPMRGLKQQLNSMALYQWSLEHIHILSFLRQRMLNMTNPKGPPVQSIAPAAPSLPLEEGRLLGEALFMRLQAWCQAHHTPLFVLTIGWGTTIQSAPQTTAFLKHAPQFFQEHQISYHDLTPEVMRRTNNDLAYYCIKNEGHVNEAGCEIISLSAWGWLKNQFSQILTSPKD